MRVKLHVFHLAVAINCFWFGQNSAAAIPQIVSSDTHTLALKSDGSLWAWGNNYRGVLGDGTTTSRPSPVLIGREFVNIAAGYLSSFAIKKDGSLWAWGPNEQGQLGDGSTTDQLRPVKIGENFELVVANWFSAAALSRDGGLWTWGKNAHGILGIGSLTPPVLTTPVRIGEGFKKLASSKAHVLALKGDGSLWGWGANGEGELGDGTLTDRYIPKLLGQGFESITAGESFSLAIKRDGTLWAWGWNAYSPLGIGKLSTGLYPDPRWPAGVFVNRPTKVSGTGYVAVTNGSYHAHAIKADNSLWGWGLGIYGALGDGLDTAPDGKTHIVYEPKKIGDEYWKTTPGGGGNSGFAITFDGTLFAWGGNAGGLLGDGTLINRLVPTNIGFNVYTDQPEVTMVSIGTLRRRSVKAQFSPARMDAGKFGCSFVAAVFPWDGSILTLSSNGWGVHDDRNPSPFRCGRLTAQEAELAIEADLSQYSGAHIYIGYGLGSVPRDALRDMLTNNRVFHRYTVE
ncbi:RCC1 domain-containing protein [Inhella sp.]|uniref:RCC1 domain-containing protein n=1 Tax=Inhella sp. TaxID=1921806 RepID=UPI0035B46CD6